jgi:hypothetical protein
MQYDSFDAQTKRSLTPDNVRMSALVLAHILTGLLGDLTGLIALAGLLRRKRLAAVNAIFLLSTFLACATGFPFLPTDGVTSAQLVSFFVTALLALACYARYRRHLARPWESVYALAATGAVFLNLLITTTQSFLHIPALHALAPKETSPLYVVLKLTLLTAFITLALLTLKRART